MGPMMGSTKAEARQGSGSRPQGRDAWVYEEGLPRICPHPLLDHLGHQLLLPTDLSSASNDVDARAIDLAQAAGAGLWVVAIIPSETSPVEVQRESLAALVRRARVRGIDAGGEIVSGSPADAILRVATAIRADAIIIGDNQWRGWHDAGGVCGHVVLHARCPVLVTHTPAATRSSAVGHGAV